MSTAANSLLGSVKNLALGSLAMGGLIFGISPKPTDYKVYYGLMHAHTLISDGSGTPEEAYKMAKANKLDFFAETPHNHDEAESGGKDRKDGILIATNTALYNGTSDQTITRQWKENNVSKSETIKVKPLLKAAADATTNTFVALYGQEFSTISSGNHMNVLGIDEVITVDNGDFKGLITLLNKLKNEGKPLPIIQFNHPDVSKDIFYNGSKDAEKKKMFNDYGVDEGDLGPHFEQMSEALNPYACLIELLSGPALTEKLAKNFRYDSHENDYYFYLCQGFHLSPSVGQDNHYKNWGAITDARMGILSDKLSHESLFTAIRERRTFASEDKNLEATLFVNDQIMGSSVKAGDETELKINVKIKDADEPGSSYKIVLYGGEINPELSTKATDWKASDGELEEIEVTGDGTHTIRGIFTTDKPQFYYVKITQDGQDRLWTAPVWVNKSFTELNIASSDAGSTEYFWTKSPSSRVYHKKNCSSVQRISSANLVSGKTPPAGRLLHDCVLPEEDEH